MAFSITPSHIIEYLFCPRFTYYEYVLRIPQFEGQRYKVQRGRDVHEQKQRQNINYLRQRIGVEKKYLNQYLTNEHLRGEVDEVLLLKEGTMAPLDFKFAKFEDRIYDTYKTQLYCYAILIEDNFGRKVHKGFLVYTRSRNKLVEIEITEQSKARVREELLAIQDIIVQNKYPKATKYKKRCLNCTYRNLCIK